MLVYCLFQVRWGAVRVAYACSKLGLSEMAETYLKKAELGFPEGQEIRSHPEFAVLLRKKTEIILDSYEFHWPLDEMGVQEILSQANEDLLQAEEILSSPFRYEQQIALTKKEKARLSILMGNYGSAYDDICSALNILPWYCHYLRADFSLIKSDAERGRNLVNRSKESLEIAEHIYQKNFRGDHPVIAVTLQKQCSLHLDFEHKSNTGKNEARKYFEASHQVCEVLKTNLKKQLADVQTEFLKNYSFDRHPILKRQKSLHERFTHNQGSR